MNDLETLELRIARVLRIGVVFSGLLMLTGFIMQFRWSANTLFNFTTYDPISFVDLLEMNFKWKRIGPLVSYAGLIALISLPFIRVILTTYLFIRQKEYLLAVIAFTVLVGLLVSAALGIKH